MCKFFVSRVILRLAVVLTLPSAALGQQAPATPAASAKTSPYTSLLGEVTAVGSDGKQITLKPEAGSPVDVTLDSKTHYLKVAPGEKDLKKATDVQFSEIGVGDRVLARVRKLDDGSVSPATTVIVMTKAAIAQQQERGQAEWQTRGVVGTVSLVNPATNEVTLKTQAPENKQIVVEPAEKVGVRRYAPNSVKFSDSTPSTIADIKTGDTIRVLGTKNDDGTRIKPEEIVYGSFTRQAGTILAIDAAAGTVKMTDLATKKPVTILVDASTSIKKLPPMMAQMMVAGQGGGRSGGAVASGAGRPGGEGGPSAAGGPPSSAHPGARDAAGPGGMRQGQGRPGSADPAAAGPGSMAPGGSASGGPGPRRMDPSKMMDRIPSITLAELKPGDAIIVSSSGLKDGMVAAISLVAGVEPLLTAPARPGQAAGPNTSWNFEISTPQ